MAGSNSRTSINHRLVAYTASCISDHHVTLHDLASLQIPMYGIDLEKDRGFPQVIDSLYTELKASQAWIFGINEHNGNPSAYTKSLVDWLSRKERSFAEGMPILLVSASPGRSGARSAQEVMAQMLEQRFGASTIFRFSLPSFGHSFDAEQGILDAEKQTEFQHTLEAFLEAF